jgi:hypothetical protein
MLIELPDHFDYDVSEIRFRVDGKDAKAVIRSLRTPEGQKALRALGESPDDEKLAEFTKALVVSHDCELMDQALLESEALRDVIYNESAQLATKFNAKKKS